MRVYLFNVENGLFLGEDFLDSGEIADGEGTTGIAPPVAHPGSVPVYDQNRGSWKLQLISDFEKKRK